MFITLKYEFNQDVKLSGGCVMALGFFDGVHIAHRELIVTARRQADEMELKLGVFTFPSESSIKSTQKRMYDTKTRLGLLQDIGVDFAVVCDFDEVASLSPEEFVKRVLIDRLDCRVAVVGYNFRFGRGATGDAKMLKNLVESHGRECIIRPEYKCDGRTVSASLIRTLVENGRIEEANHLLGTPYRISGVVSHGRGEGKGLGFPTVNTAIDERYIVPKRGVYRTAVKINGEIYTGITNIGTCPTFGAREVHLETYIIDFEGDIYGENTDIYLLGYLRDEMTFNTPEELKMQINIDKNTAIIENGEIKWQELGLK